MAKLPHPVIVVPGITGNDLRDDYALPPEHPWTVLNRRHERVALHPDDLRFERLQPSRLQPGPLFEVAYAELIEELRHNLSLKADQPVPVYPFAYDWRQPLSVIEAQLAEFIDEVIDRTKLMRHFDADGYALQPRVNLVGHSMGGLIITGCLERLARQGSAKGKIAKVATLGTPFKGSFEAVMKISTGTGHFGGDAPSSRERESARLTPSLYHLFPSMPHGVEFDEGLPSCSLFEVQSIQASVLDTLTDHIRQHGLNKVDRGGQAKALLSEMLTQAWQHRQRIEGFELAALGMQPSDWLCVAGVGAMTRVKMRVSNVGGQPVFAWSDSDRMDAWRQASSEFDSEPEAQLRRLTGDGTVPLHGALPGFLAWEHLVCVTPDDFAYWELKDRALLAMAGFHGSLPNMNLVHRLITHHFRRRRHDAKPMSYDQLWGRPAPGVSPAAWAPALPGLEARSRA